MFSFNSDKFDFKDIVEAVNYYYPIKGKISTVSKELKAVIIDNIHNEENFANRWSAFTKEIEKETGKEIIGTTFGQTPSFSAYVLLETAIIDNLTRTKELHFFVSLTGPFYTVIGQDCNTVKLGENKNYRTTSYLVISPENEFADTFEFLCQRIEDRFKGFRFIPFVLCKQTSGERDVQDTMGHPHSLFNALFNDHIDVTMLQKTGDQFFKSEDWIKEGYTDAEEAWKIYPPITPP